MNKKSMHKKGNAILDMFLAAFMLFVIVICLFVASYVYREIRDNTTLFSGADEGGSAMQGEIGTWGDVVTNMFPYIFIMVMVSIIVALLLSAYLIQSSNVFLVVGAIILIIATIVSVPLANFYEEFTTSTGDFEDVNSDFSIPNFIMGRLPYFVFLMGATFLLVMFGKKSPEGGVVY